MLYMDQGQGWKILVLALKQTKNLHWTEMNRY